MRSSMDILRSTYPEFDKFCEEMEFDQDDITPFIFADSLFRLNHKILVPSDADDYLIRWNQFIKDQ